MSLRRSSGHAGDAYGAKGILAKPRQSLQGWRGLSLAEAPWRGIQRSPDGSPLEHGRVHEAGTATGPVGLSQKSSLKQFSPGVMSCPAPPLAVAPTSIRLPDRSRAVPRSSRDMPGHHAGRPPASSSARRTARASPVNAGTYRSDPEARYPRSLFRTHAPGGHYLHAHARWPMFWPDALRWVRRYPALTGWVASWRSPPSGQAGPIEGLGWGIMRKEVFPVNTP